MTTAVIGGTGLDQWAQKASSESLDATLSRPPTPYGLPSGSIQVLTLISGQMLFLPRHGVNHDIAPHQVNYRANLWALREAGAKRVVAVNAVGGIAPQMDNGKLLIPDQLIDYTWGRLHSYCDSPDEALQHVDFTNPFEPGLRKQLLSAAQAAGVAVHDTGCVGVTQGPRLETAAEIIRLQRDGCDVVGMTSMPEAALARELGLPYASIAVVANRAAGMSSEVISMQAIGKVLEHAMQDVRALLSRLQT